MSRLRRVLGLAASFGFLCVATACQANPPAPAAQAAPPQAQPHDAPFRIQTSRGVFSVDPVGDALDGAYELRWNGKVLLKDSNDSGVTLVSSSGKPDDQLLVLAFTSLGTACPALYRVVDLAAAPAPHISASFGNCSDTPKITNAQGQAVLGFPGFRHATGQRWSYSQHGSRGGQLARLGPTR